MEQSIPMNEVPTTVMPEPQPTGFLDMIKQQAQGIINKLKDSKSTLIDITLYGGIGFLSGFLLRRYSAYIAFFVLLIVGLIILQQMDVISIAINWIKVEEFFGIQRGATTTGDTLIVALWEWVKANFVIVISYIVGFLLGLRIG